MSSPALLASYFTLAGDVVPLRDTGPSPRDFRDRVEAAARAGFSGFGLFYTDLPAVIARYGYPGMRSILTDNGITRLELEALIDWFADGERGAAAAPARELLLRSAEALGAFQVKAAGDLSGDWPLDAMVTGFARLCDQARSAGTRVSIEILPFSNIATLDRALEIIRAADRPNGGLMLDIWHMERGGIDLEDIAALPADLIYGVELNDAGSEVEGTLLEDTVYRRRFCGQGDFDVAGFVAAVRRTGYDGPYGIEVLSDAVRQLPLEQVAAMAYRTTSRFTDP